MTVATEVRQITPELYSWEAYEPAVKYALTSCAVVTPEGLVLIDPIDLLSAAWAPLFTAHPPIAILLTNGNHARAAADWRTRLGIRIFAPADASAELELVPDATVQAGELAPGGFRVVGLASAGPGEVAYVGQGIACLGDAVVNLPSTGLALLPDKYCAAPARLPEDLRKLLSLDFHILTLAHGPPLADHARARLTKLLP
jgi:hypothetical protein